MDLSPLHSLASSTIEKYGVPGMVILFARKGDEPQAIVLGTDAAGNPVQRDSLFIVASITKLATALCVLRLIDRGAFGLDDALANFLPHARAAQPGVTLRNLLCHVSGMPQDLPDEHTMYGKPLDWEVIGKACLQVELVREPRTRVVYSNVGYGLLALVVEQVAKKPFEQVLQAEVLRPLGIKGVLGSAPPRATMQLADVRSRHAGTDIEPFNSEYYLRLGLPWSGLVTAPDSAIQLVRAFAGVPGDFLSESLRREATTNQTGDLPGGYGSVFEYEQAPWGLGPDLRGHKSPHWTPPNADAGTFGHAGASGCCVWYDPTAKIAWAIFGTRTADNGWLVRGGSKIAQAKLNEMQAQNARTHPKTPSP